MPYYDCKSDFENGYQQTVLFKKNKVALIALFFKYWITLEA